MRLITPFLILITLFLVSCGQHVRPDPGPVPIDAWYPTLEMYVDGKLYHGVAVTYKKDLNFVFEVQGYYDGELTVASKNCNFNETYSYKNSQRIRVNLRKEALLRNCIFVATMSPSYPGEDRGVPIESLIGFLALKVNKDGKVAWGRALKARNPARGSVTIPVGDIKQARVVLNGCGRSYDKVLPVKNDSVTIRLEDIVERFQGFCVVDGLVISDEYQDLVVVVAVASHGPSYVPPAIPVVSVSGDKLTVEAEQAVTAVSLNNTFVLKNKATFQFDKSKKGQIVRAITAKGRTVLGVWNGRGFDWKQ